MHCLDQGHVELELLIGGPTQAPLRFSKVVQQDEQFLLADGVAKPGFIRLTLWWVDLADQDIA
jgi:hypothetical protein